MIKSMISRLSAWLFPRSESLRVIVEREARLYAAACELARTLEHVSLGDADHRRRGRVLATWYGLHQPLPISTPTAPPSVDSMRIAESIIVCEHDVDEDDRAVTVSWRTDEGGTAGWTFDEEIGTGSTSRAVAEIQRRIAEAIDAAVEKARVLEASNGKAVKR